MRKSSKNNKEKNLKEKNDDSMTFLSSSSHIFFPLTTHCFPNDNRVHLANRKKRKEGERGTRKREQSVKGLQEETIFLQFYQNFLREKGVSGFTLCEQYPFHPPLFTRVVSLAAGNFIQPSPYTPGPLFDYALLFPLFESGTQRGGGKGIKKSQPSFPFSSLLEAAKKVFF